MSDDMNFEEFAWAPFIDKLVEEVLDKGGVPPKPSGPICRDCPSRIVMQHITDDLYQCPTCKRVEVV